VEEAAAVDVRNRAHRITATVDWPDGGANGTLVSQGSGYGGYVLAVVGGELMYVHNFVGLEESRVTAPLHLAPGAHELGMRFDKVGDATSGVATLIVDGEDVGSVHVPRFTPTRWSITGDGLTIGYTASLPVSRDLATPDRFGAPIRSVVVEVPGAPVVDAIAEARLAMRAQ
jgi:arylsulfatase